jgi:hypothetical protein
VVLQPVLHHVQHPARSRQRSRRSPVRRT